MKRDVRLQTATVIRVVLFTVIWITRVQILLASITLSCLAAQMPSVWRCVGVECPLLDVDSDMQTHPLPISGEKCLLGVNGARRPTQAEGALSIMTGRFIKPIEKIL